MNLEELLQSIKHYKYESPNTMMCYRDRTWCASPECKNECERQLQPEDLEIIEETNMPVAYGYFCGEDKC